MRRLALGMLLLLGLAMASCGKPAVPSKPTPLYTPLYTFDTRSNEVTRKDAAGHTLWTVTVGGKPGTGGFDGRLVDEPGGILLAFRYHPLFDSGVDVARIDPSAGKVVWNAKCEPLGGFNSKYRHQASVAVVGKTVQVTSEASGGSFVEVLDLQNGKQLSRTLYAAKIDW